MIKKNSSDLRSSIIGLRSIIIASCILHLASLTPAYSQLTVSGFVTDKETTDPLPGANIVLENSYLSTVSDKNGYFKIRNLKPGNISMKILFMGYENLSVDFLLLRDTTLNLQMVAKAILGEEVNIIATRAQPKTPATFSILTLKQIDAVNVGQDLPYIIQSTPSVVVTSDAGTGIGYTGINIRGTDLTRINVTLNGIPLNDAETQGVWFVDLPDLASSTENIQVQRGVGTSTNGAAAFGATINIQTMNVNKDPYAEADISGGLFATLKSTLRFGSGLLKERFAVDGRVSFVTSQGYIDRAWSNLKSFYLSAGYFGKTTTLKLNILSGWEKTYQAWEGVPKDSLSTNRRYNPAGEYTDKNGNITYYDNQTDNYHQNHYQLIFSREIGRKLNINAALHYTSGFGYYESYKEEQPFENYGLSNVISGNDTIAETNLVNRKYLDNGFYGITFSGNYTPTYKLKVTAGGAYNFYDGLHYGNIIWAEYASDGDNERDWYNNTGKKKDFNIFGKISYRVFDKLTLFADMQYRYVNYIIDGTLDDLRQVDQRHTFNFFNPKAGIYFDINDRQNIYFSFAIGNREPNRNNYEAADQDNIPAPERLYDYELGYNLKGAKFTMGANLYYMNYHDQLVLTGMINNVGEAIMTNVPESYRTGLEITASANIFKWLGWNFSGTVSRNRISEFTEYVDTYDSVWNFTGQTSTFLGNTTLSFSPSPIISNTFTFRPARGLSFSLISRYVGKQFIDNTSNDERKLDPWFVNNIHVDYRLRTKVLRELGFTLLVSNLFSEKYESNAWVYRYNYDGQPFEANGYFPQALINVLIGISIKI